MESFQVLEGRNEGALQEHSGFPVQCAGLQPLAAGAALSSAARGEQDGMGGQGDCQEGAGRLQRVTVVGDRKLEVVCWDQEVARAVDNNRQETNFVNLVGNGTSCQCCVKEGR